MAIPRRFDRRPPERDTTRINERIRVAQVRLIGDDGAQIGVIPIDQALEYAQERDLDLVEVAPEAKPPVCRALDYSKYKYEQAQKAKASRKHQQQITIREMKLRPKIAQNDYETKKGHVSRFLRQQDKVKVTIMFRGREMAHPDRGYMLLQRLAEDLHELGTVEQSPLQDGRNMTMVLAPVKSGAAGLPSSTKAAPEKAAPSKARKTKDLDADAKAAGSIAGPAAATGDKPVAKAEPKTQRDVAIAKVKPAAKASKPAKAPKRTVGSEPAGAAGESLEEAPGSRPPKTKDKSAAKS